MRIYDMAFEMGKMNAMILDNLEKEMNRQNRVPVRKVIKAGLKIAVTGVTFQLNPLNIIRAARDIAKYGFKATLMNGINGSIDGSMEGLHINRMGAVNADRS